MTREFGISSTTPSDWQASESAALRVPGGDRIFNHAVVNDPGLIRTDSLDESGEKEQLLRAVQGSQNQLESQLAALQREGGNAGLAAVCSAQLSVLAALQFRISVAGAGALAALRSEAATTLTAAALVVQQVGATAAGRTAAAESAQLGVARGATRWVVLALGKDLFEDHIFDRYLSFTPPEEEEAYRRREAENRRFMEEQLARGTPEGDLNAAGGAMDQMLAAHTHGAGESPAFLPRWTRLAESTRQLRESMRHAGQSTEAFDRRLTDSVRRYLEAKGLSEAEIEACLASSPDPLNAVKPYLKTEHEARALEGSVHLLNGTSVRAGDVAALQVVKLTDAPAGTTESVLARQAEGAPNLDDVMAKLHASGVSMADDQTPVATRAGAAAQERPGLSKPARRG